MERVMKEILQKLGIQGRESGAFSESWLSLPAGAPALQSRSPIDSSLLGEISLPNGDHYEEIVRTAENTFRRWRAVPAPVRGAVVREIGEAFRARKRELGTLITLETGKILAEGEGEVQEAIDIAEFAVGLSRQLYGKTMHSERPAHRMYEQWHPLGLVGVITAFNFPFAVWAWNAMLAAVCGDVVVWKPSELTPLTAIATTKICAEVTARHGFPGLFPCLIGDGPGMGKRMAEDRRFPLISATGSCRMGRAVGETVARRLGRVLLELGGNNAVIVAGDADLDLVVRSTVFGAVGTAGQRCTTTRRLIVHESIAAELTSRLSRAYKQVKIGNPLEAGTLMGPLINQAAVDGYHRAIAHAKEQGGEVVTGGASAAGFPNNLYVQPTLIKAAHTMPIVAEETFAPILYVMNFKDLDSAIEMHNAVPQGLSSAIFTRDLATAERFLSALGSDCGIANVNLGTSGAEIGGAFGGEKDTGGGRESGSDSWTQYMRRQTNTINYSKALPLAQGIKFDVEG